MRIFYNLDNRSFVTAATGSTPFVDFTFKLGDDADDIELSFLRGGSVVEWPDGSTGVLGFKEKGKYDADYIVSALSWTKSGTGQSTTYIFAPDFNTDELKALLKAEDGDAEDDIPFVTLMGEFKWVVAGKRASTPQFDAVVWNNVNKGGEGLPTSANPPISQLITPDVRSALTVDDPTDYVISTWISNTTIVPVTVNDFSSGTATVSLDPTDARGIVELVISLPAAAGLVLAIYSANVSGSLETFTTLTEASTAYFRGYWDTASGAWKRLTAKHDTP